MKLLPIITSLLLIQFVHAGKTFYKNTNVLELDNSNFDEIVINTNHTSVVEFYASWCGHCQNLKPEYTKVGNNLKDISIVGAVNCELKKNKQLCSRFRIEGYPTILAFRPPKIDINKRSEDLKYGHATETYSGPRNFKSIVEFTVSRIKNYVKRVSTDLKLQNWFKSSERVKLVVFTKRDKLNSLLKSIAIDYLGVLDVSYVPIKGDKFKEFVKYGIDEDKSSILLFYNDTHVKYDGEFNKQDLYTWLSQIDELKETSLKSLKRIEYLTRVSKGEKVKRDEL